MFLERLVRPVCLSLVDVRLRPHAPPKGRQSAGGLAECTLWNPEDLQMQATMLPEWRTVLPEVQKGFYIEVPGVVVDAWRSL